MGLDVDAPEPPDLTNRGSPSGLDFDDVDEWSTDLRRGELETILREGAWQEAFDEWAEYTDVSEDVYQTIRDRGLLRELDFYWDPNDERLRFDVPPIPSEWTETDDLSTVKSELTDLGHTVVEMIEDSYVDWEGGEPDEPWTKEAFAEEPTGEAEYEGEEEPSGENELIRDEESEGSLDEL